ncbi:hypothetical protein CRUP_023929 [Coryphaenoides rupestris]|nr:hypothetical protein CRUP_023929 [Coryphaenoides rupestris]
MTTTANNKETNSDGCAAEDEIQVETASREEQTEEPALCSTSAVIENIPQDMSKEIMEKLVENICKNFKSPMSTEQEFSLEILSNMCSAVVTFSSGKENNDFITSCQTNRMFLKKNLSVRPLEATTKVKVEDVSNIHPDFLLLYFEGEGWEVEEVTPDEEEQSAIISFKMPAAWEVSETEIREMVLNKAVEVIPDKGESALSVIGFVEDVIRLEPILNELLSRIEKRFLKDEDEGNLTNVLTSNGIHAAVERVGTALNILALSDISLKNAEDQLKQVLISRCIDVDDCNILKTVQWQNLVKDLEGSTNTASKKVVITTSNARQLERVTVVGYKDSVIPISIEIQEHLHKYSQVNETLPVQHDVILRYIETQSNTLSDEVKDKVVISYGKKSVNFRGPREDVKKCKHKFVTLISSLYFEEYQLAKPGAKEFFQVVVNVVGKDLVLEKGAISKAILGAAGPILQVLLTENGRTGNFGDVIVTNGCNLKSNMIFHAVVPNWENPGYAHKIMTGIVQDCLNEAERRGLTSITFPAIGTGNLGFPKGIAASVMIEEFLKFKKQSMSLKTVVIVLYPKDRKTIQVFNDELKKRLFSRVTTASGKHEMTIRHVKVEVVLGDITKETTDVIVNSSNPSFNLKSGQGNAQAGQVADAMLDAVVDMVAQSVQSCLKVVRIIIFEPDMMKDFVSRMEKRAASDKQNIGIFGTIKESACFHICGSSLANVHQAKMWITHLIDKEQGHTTIKNKAVLNLCKANVLHISDIQKTMNVIVKIKDDSITIEGFPKNLLQATTEIQDMLGNIRDDMETRQILDTIDWQYKFEGLQFQSIDPTSSFLLEQALIKNQPHQQTAEYNEVLQLFSTTCKKTVIKIERIQTAGMWKSLQIKQQDMELRNGHKNNERRLFHGTCPTTIKAINEYGFNRSFAGKNATSLGKGIYFAVNASYSASDTYSKPDAQGQKYMYLCRVLTGDYTTGTANLIVPPCKPSSTMHYDSVVDNMQNMCMFVIFYDNQAYPEYLITFK